MASSFFATSLKSAPNTSKNQATPVRRLFPSGSPREVFDAAVPLSSAEPLSVGPCKRIHVRTRRVTVTPVCTTPALLPPTEAGDVQPCNLFEDQKQVNYPITRKICSQIRLKPAASLDLGKSVFSPKLVETCFPPSLLGLYNQQVKKTYYHARTRSDTTHGTLTLDQTLIKSRSISISKLTGTTQGSFGKTQSSQKPVKRQPRARKWTWTGTGGPVKL